MNLRVQEKAKAAGTRAPTVVLSGETVSAGDIGNEISLNGNTSLLPKSNSPILPYLNDAGFPWYIAPGFEVGSPEHFQLHVLQVKP